MAYQNQCHFLKTQEDDANPTNAPDLVEPENEDQNSAGARSDQPGFTAAQTWAREQQMAASGDSGSAQNMPMHTVVSSTSTPLFEGVKSPPSASSMFQFVPGETNGDANDMSVSPGGQSGGPTSNSSTASEQQQQHRARMANQINGSASTSYDASPAPAPQTLTSNAGVDGQGNFYDPNGFPMSAQAVPQNQRYPVQQPQMEFPMANGWGPMQTGQPVAEGVLRSLMNMGPMDAMDLSSWDSGN
ncbi:hypothetical protein VUR80DRAFT_8451 [Thermomyces stellatus]